MAKQAASTPDVETEKPATVEQKIMLDEFCLRKSAPPAPQRPELLGGFQAREKRAGRLKDTESAYAARFEAFKNTPV